MSSVGKRTKNMEDALLAAAAGDVAGVRVVGAGATREGTNRTKPGGSLLMWDFIQS